MSTQSTPAKRSTSKNKPVTTRLLQKMKKRGQRISMLTAYDATFARILDDAGVDILLVGDSLGMVIQGHETTLPVTLDEMIYHTRSVRRGTRRAQVVGDMPFMSYQISATDALRNAGRLIQEGGASAVKLEGGTEVAEHVARITSAGIPVMGHIGLTPQSVHQMGGYRIQGKSKRAGEKLLADAKALEKAGAYSIVLEGIPASLAARITDALRIPTIGIGAGVDCDGQVLVIYDLLGMQPDFTPKFVKKYDNFHQRITDATTAFIGDVRSGAFPAAEHSFDRLQVISNEKSA